MPLTILTRLLQFVLMIVVMTILYQWKHNIVSIEGFTLHMGYWVLLSGNSIAGIFATGGRLC